MINQPGPKGESRPSRCLHTTRRTVSSGLAVFLCYSQAPGAQAYSVHRNSLKSVVLIQNVTTVPLYHRLINCTTEWSYVTGLSHPGKTAAGRQEALLL